MGTVKKYLKIGLYEDIYSITSYLMDDNSIPKIKLDCVAPFRGQGFIHVYFTEDGRFANIHQPSGGTRVKMDLPYLKENGIPKVKEIYDTVIIEDDVMKENGKHKVYKTLHNIDFIAAFEEMLDVMGNYGRYYPGGIINYPPFTDEEQAEFNRLFHGEDWNGKD
ncbi:MAG: hypothetical protein LBH05_02125 [Deferribacteraceae bacterium]|jgi:hypothetical protein|nr:hypothetical protein [Deferribacteraceae bacterium]